MKGYFFDTYALFEMLKANPNYLPFCKNDGFAITKLNLLELHYAILRTQPKEEADKIFDTFSEHTIDITDDDYKNASAMKLHYKKQRLSYVDCVGYCMARRLGIKFLTGDNEFKGLENVEFVR